MKMIATVSHMCYLERAIVSKATIGTQWIHDSWHQNGKYSKVLQPGLEEDC